MKKPTRISKEFCEISLLSAEERKSCSDFNSNMNRSKPIWDCSRTLTNLYKQIWEKLNLEVDCVQYIEFFRFSHFGLILSSVISFAFHNLRNFFRGVLKQRCLQDPVKYPRWSFLAKYLKGRKSLGKKISGKSRIFNKTKI